MLHEADLDTHFMKLALNEAVKAYEIKEVPIGCIITHDNKIIGRAHNQVEQLRDATAHAEMIAITQASEALDSWRLNECTLYTTLEPCFMCAGAIQLARIPRIVFAAHDPKKGACGSLCNTLTDIRFNHTAEIFSGVLAQDASDLLSHFFQELRKPSL